MAVPNFQIVMLPLLRVNDDGAQHTTVEVIEKLATHFNLSPDEREELLPSGTQRRFDNRVNWAAAYLRRAALLESLGRGRFRITPRGLEVLRSNPDRVDIKLLTQFPEYNWATSSGDNAVGPESPAVPDLDQTPEEVIESTAGQLEDALAQQILDTLTSVSPTFFEQVVVDLLVAMDYGGTGGTGKRIGKSGDGGIDGTIDQDPLGLDVVYIQAKRWQGSVGREVVQAFAGSLEGNKATKGLMITTSWFSSGAVTYIGMISKRIVLIDGRTLARLMIRYGLGVKSTATYVLKQLDTDYFAPGEMATEPPPSSTENQ